MRKRIEALADQLEEFVSEDEHDVLWVECEGEAVPLVAAAIDLNEQRGSPDASIVLLAPDESTHALAERLALELEACATGLSLPPLVDVPSEVSTRCVRWADHVATTLAAQDRRLVIWLLPTERCALTSVAPLLCCLLEAPAVGRRALRLAARRGEGLPVAIPRAARARTIAFEHSPAALREALRDEAAAPTSSRAERAAAALTLAMADAAAGRPGDALDALARLADTSSDADASTRALAFALAGPVLARLGALDDARMALRRALTMSRELPAVALSSVFSLGHVALAQGDLAEADACFDLAARVAHRLGWAAAVGHALALRADVFGRAGLEARRHDALVCAATAARRAGDVALLRSALVALRELLTREGDDRAAAAVAVHLVALPDVHEHAHEDGAP